MCVRACASLHLCLQCEIPHVLCVHERVRVQACGSVLFCECVCACACVQLGIIWQCGSEEGQGIKDHKKCMTADNFSLLIKIC